MDEQIYNILIFLYDDRALKRYYSALSVYIAVFILSDDPSDTKKRFICAIIYV